MSAMMRSAAIYGGLLVVLSGASWMKWTAAPAVELDGKVVMVDGTPDELTRVVWLEKDKDQSVIVRKTDGLGVYYEVEQTRWTAPKPEKKPPAPAEDGAAAPDGATPDGAPPDGAAPSDGANPADGDPPAEAPPLEASVQHFKAGEKADELMASLRRCSRCASSPTSAPSSSRPPASTPPSSRWSSTATAAWCASSSAARSTAPATATPASRAARTSGSSTTS